MTRLALDQAPPARLPRRFLLTAPAWGVVAGGLLLFDAEAALWSRWAPATLALVHVFTLGLLGNAMLGSLLQFLPAAAGVRVRGGVLAAGGLHLLFNLGVVALVTGLRWSYPPCLWLASACLAAAFVHLAVMTLPGLFTAAGQRMLRGGIAVAISAGVVTAALGVAMVLGLTGVRGGLPLRPWVDIHAAIGLLGWIGILLASVASVVMPMFQGTAPPRPATQGLWLLATVAVLLSGTICAIRGHDVLLRWGSALCAATFAVDALRRQWQARHKRNPWLVRTWRTGLLLLLTAALVLVLDGAAMLTGVLVLAIGLPLLLAGMQLEIVAFLTWIELHRHAGRGVRLPAVRRLLPEAEKMRVFILLLGSGVALLVAVAWPQPALVRLAGALLLGTHAVLFLVLHGAGRRGDRFLRSLENPP
jgi:hypothetical protein